MEPFHHPPHLVPQPKQEQTTPPHHLQMSQEPHQPMPGPPGHGSAPSSQIPGHPSFRRQRASRACETCHARKVRCDAASLGVPCTNCVAFSIECKIPAPKRKKTQGKGKDNEESVNGEPPQDAPLTAMDDERPRSPQIEQGMADRISRALTRDENTTENTETTLAARSLGKDGTYAQVMKPKFVRAPIKEAGRVAYLGESSNLSLLVHDRHGTADVVHYPLPENIKGQRARMDELDGVEIEILHQRGAFLLPPRGLCDELVEAFFTWISPVVPVINRSRFMRRYRDSKNPPSLLLLQAILLAGSRVCRNPQLMDANGSTTPAAMTFYKRAKALFDANYEDDRVTIVQALILMGWYWEGPEDVTKNVFYWSRVAIIVAQGSGMHRSVDQSQLSKADKRLWKRIWWCLFTRDRSVAVALGRPCCINTEDSDVDMVTEDDFLDDEVDRPSEYQADPVHVQFFLNYVKLTEIMGLVLSQQYSAACKNRKADAFDLTASDMALADWLTNCSKLVYWDKSNHNYWAALLQMNYYTTLCLLHRAHMPPAGTPMTTSHNGMIMNDMYPSRNIAYKAAGTITAIVESLQKHDQLRYTPAFIVYSLFSALIMHIYQMRSTNASIKSITEQRLQICMQALKDVAKTWLVAKMVHTLFESILGNKVLEEKLQKAAGRKHQREKNATNKAQKPVKRKHDDLDDEFKAPQQQMSYERSRPQSPANDPEARSKHQQAQAGLHPNGGQQMPNLTMSNDSPEAQRNHDAFMGASQGDTRAPTPFRNVSMPGTPPELFLATRHSPTIPAELWNNFQPDQLFPGNNQDLFPSGQTISPTQGPAYLDPQLGQMQQQHQQQQQQQQAHPGQQQTPPNQQQQQYGGWQQHQQPFQSNGMPMPMPSHQQQGGQGGGGGSGAVPRHMMHGGWHGMGIPQAEHQDADSWSNSNASQGPPVPTTLNVEDWFQFIGITGEGGHASLYGQ